MAKTVTAFKLNLTEQEYEDLRQVAETITEVVGIDVTMSWVIRNFVRVMARGPHSAPKTLATKALMDKMHMASDPIWEDAGA